MLYSIFFIAIRKRMWNDIHYIIRAGAYVCARKEKRIVLTETSGIFRHISSLQKNARTFDIKRKCVSIQTQGRFGSNASAFRMERKGVFSRTKNKGEQHTKKVWGVLKIVVSLKINSWLSWQVKQIIIHSQKPPFPIEIGLLPQFI